MKQQFKDNKTVTELIARNPNAMVINHKDAFAIIGRLGWRGMSEAEKAKNEIPVNKNIIVTKHAEAVIATQLTEGFASMSYNQIKMEAAILLLANQAHFEMQRFGSYYEDTKDGNKLPKYESVLYQNIKKNGVLILPNDVQKCVLYDGSELHHALLDDGVSYMEHCNTELSHRRALLYDQQKNAKAYVII